MILILAILVHFAFADTPRCFLSMPPQIPPSEADKLRANELLREWTEKLPNDVTEEELITRLVYAETLATNCKDKVAPGRLARGIAWVIRNRVDMAKDYPSKSRQYGTGWSGVVFKKKQFNSSLSTEYSLSQWPQFWCPTDKALWATVRYEVQKIFINEATPPFTPVATARAVTMVYYYRHYDSHPEKKPKTLPAWASPENPYRVSLSGTTPEIDQCIGFFKDSLPQSTRSADAQKK